jgi:hypothetical protein
MEKPKIDPKELAAQLADLTALAGCPKNFPSTCLHHGQGQCFAPPEVRDRCGKPARKEG